MTRLQPCPAGLAGLELEVDLQAEELGARGGGGVHLEGVRGGGGSGRHGDLHGHVKVAARGHRAGGARVVDGAEAEGQGDLVRAAGVAVVREDARAVQLGRDGVVATADRRGRGGSAGQRARLALDRRRRRDGRAREVRRVGGVTAVLHSRRIAQGLQPVDGHGHERRQLGLHRHHRRAQLARLLARATRHVAHGVVLGAAVHVVRAARRVRRRAAAPRATRGLAARLPVLARRTVTTVHREDLGGAHGHDSGKREELERHDRSQIG
mmetsp:Transcript_23318/g.75095  ORF Transcript_23318/g.75095 Transcript_23318/m.75095 type:complete len:267 (-) Transcript_23318:8-808(-)